MDDLDEVVSAFVLQNEDVYKEDAPEDQKELLRESLKTVMKEKIRDEIIAETEKSIRSQIEQEIKRNMNKKRLDDLKSLIGEGFMLAFMVGLLVNQVTELIGYWTHSTWNSEGSRTVLVTIVLGLICAGVYFAVFVKRAMVFINEWKNM